MMSINLGLLKTGLKSSLLSSAQIIKEMINNGVGRKICTSSTQRQKHRIQEKYHCEGQENGEESKDRAYLCLLLLTLIGLLTRLRLGSYLGVVELGLYFVLDLIMLLSLVMCSEICVHPI